MTENNTQTTQGRSTGGRIGLIVAGAVAGYWPWAHSPWGPVHYGLTVRRTTGATWRPTASASPPARVPWPLRTSTSTWTASTGSSISGELGKVQCEVASKGDEPVFVGIARTADVTSYLRGVDHTLVTDVDADPFEASYQRESGDRRPAAPAQESFWVAS